MRRALAALLGGVTVALAPAGLGQAASSTPCPSGAPGGGSPGCSTAAQQQALAQIRQRLSADLVEALVVQQDLAQSLADNRQQEARIQASVQDNRSQAGQLDAQISKIDRQAAETRNRITVERAQIAAIARALYTQPDSLLVVLARSRNPSESLANVYDLMAAGARARSLQAQLNSDLAQLSQESYRERQAQYHLNQLQSGLDHELSQLDALKSRQQATLAQLEAAVAATQQEFGAAGQESSAVAAQLTYLLENEEAAIFAAAMEQVWDEVRIVVEAETTTGLDLGVAGGNQAFIWPELNPVVTQGFGPSSLVLEPPYGGFAHFHTGIDMAEPENSPIIAAAAGVVVLTGFDPGGYGNFVVILHAGGLESLYGHMNQVGVEKGQQVAQGQPIGLEGSTGNSTGPHLHFEIRANGTPLDPAIYLPQLPSTAAQSSPPASPSPAPSPG